MGEEASITARQRYLFLLPLPPEPPIFDQFERSIDRDLAGEPMSRIGPVGRKPQSPSLNARRSRHRSFDDPHGAGAAASQPPTIQQGRSAVVRGNACLQQRGAQIGALGKLQSEIAPPYFNRGRSFHGRGVREAVDRVDSDRLQSNDAGFPDSEALFQSPFRRPRPTSPLDS